MTSVRIVGPGRVGSALAAALAGAGWAVREPVRREDDPRLAAHDVDLVVITTPDAAIPLVAARMEPADRTVVAHASGALGLDVLTPHSRRASIHPLASVPAGPLGVQRLTGGIRFAVAGDPLGRLVVDALGGEPFVVPDADRAAYHAAACIASNHLVALLGQVERVAATVGLPLDTFAGLVQGTIDAVAELGPRAALTGPAARGDVATMARHLAALAPEERPAYEAMAERAARLAHGPGGA